jgi:hypothetical protein
MRNKRKTTEPADSSGRGHGVRILRQTNMARDLAEWNLGMEDAEAGRLAAPNRSQDYYDGYYYACAVNYEYMETRPEPDHETGLCRTGSVSAPVAAVGFSAQLERLNCRLLDSQSNPVWARSPGN